MYLLADRSIDIACSQERAFTYAADLETFPKWFPGVLEIASNDALPFTSLGKQYREAVVVPMRGKQTVFIRVTDISAPHRLVTEGSLALLLPRMEIEVERVGRDACRVRWRMMSRNAGALPRWTVLPWARRVITKRAEKGLRALKAILERSGETASRCSEAAAD